MDFKNKNKVRLREYLQEKYELPFQYSASYLSGCTNEEKVELLNRKCNKIVFSGDSFTVKEEFYIEHTSEKIKNIFGEPFFEFVSKNHLLISE